MVKKLLPILFIFLVWLIFSKPFFIDNKIPYPSDFQVNHFTLWASYPSFWSPVKNPAQPDVISQIMPWKKLTIESLTNLQIPFWNPYSFSGTPHLANYQSSPFSISNIFYFIFDFKIAWSLAVLIQPLLAGIFTYFFAKSLKRSELAGVLSGVSFMFCGFITTWMSYTTLSLAISFLPLALFAIQKYFETKKLRFLLILSISYPLSFFSGHFQISLYFLLFIFSYLVFKYFETKNKSAFLKTILFSFFGILLSFPQILPTIELYFSSLRSDVFQKTEAIPLKYLTTIIAPDFYGNPVTRNNFWGHYIEWAGFFGIVPFSLAIFSMFKRNKYVLFFLIMGILSLIFSVDTPIIDYLVKLKMPVISTSAASRIIVLFSFSLSILAAFGLDDLKKALELKEIKKIFIWLSILSLIFIVLWILTIGKIIEPNFYLISLKNLILPSILFLFLIISVGLGLINKKLITLSLILVIFFTSFEMLRCATKWQSFSDMNLVYAKTPIISKLTTLDNNYRTIGAFGADGSVYFHILGVEGYDPLYINRYGEFIGSLNDGKIKESGNKGLTFPANAKFAPQVIDLLGIKYVLHKKADNNKPWAFPFGKYPGKFSEIYREKDLYIYENNDVFPRAYLVGDYAIETDNQKIINKILDKNFDLRKSVVLESDPGIEKTNNLVGKTEIIDYSPNNIKIGTNANRDSILILTDNFYPGWKVKVNGEEEKIIRAAYTFRAVAIPKGENNIEFYYDSDSFKWGAYLAIFSVVLILIIIVLSWYTKSKWKQKTSATKQKQKRRKIKSKKDG